jgi:hypothetical protein
LSAAVISFGPTLIATTPVATTMTARFLIANDPQASKAHRMFSLSGAERSQSVSLIEHVSARPLDLGNQPS